MLKDDVTLFPLETVALTGLFTQVQTPAAPRTDHTMNTETTVTMPKAIDSRNDTFITDHGSMRLRRKRARRGARPAAGDVRRVVAEGADGAGDGWTGRSWVRGGVAIACVCSVCPARPLLVVGRSAGGALCWALCWAISAGGGGSTRPEPP